MGVQVPEGSVRVGDAMGGHGEDSAGARSGGHVDAHRPCRCVEGDGGAECGFPWGERQLDVEVAAIKPVALGRHEPDAQDDGRGVPAAAWRDGGDLDPVTVDRAGGMTT